MQGQARHPNPTVRSAKPAFPALRAMVGLCALLAMALVTLGAPQAQANPRYASLVIDAVSGEVLHERYADRVLHPASLTKMMTLYLAFQAIDQGRFTLNQRLNVSARAAAQPPTKIGLPAGATIRMEDALYALSIRSANDIAVVVAEALAGSESRFAQLMTQEARRLGMTQTVFRNASGLPDAAQVSTARDMARLAQALLRDYPHHYHFFSRRTWSFNGTNYQNTNRLLGSYEGMDGMKTGYIRASGFNLVASARRGNLRVIGVVFGGRTTQTRNDHMVALLNSAFSADRGRYLVAHGSQPFAPPMPPRHPSLPVGPPLQLVAATPAAPSAPARSGAAPGAIPIAVLPPSLPPSADRPTAEQVMVALGAIPTPPAVPHHLRPDDSYIAIAEGDMVLGEGEGGDAPGRSGALEVAALPAGGWAIQIGAFSEPEAGQRALDIASSYGGDLFAGAARSISPVRNDAGATLYRARMIGLDQASAVAACRRMGEAGLSCLTIAPD